MKKTTLRKIALSSIAGMLAVGVFVSTTYSWFLQKGDDTTVSFTAGKVEYSVNNDFFIQNSSLVVPGQNLFANSKKMTLTNSSTIDTNLRIKISYEIGTDATAITGTSISSATADALYCESLASNSNWVYSDGYYYYKSANETTGKIATTVSTIDFIDSLTINGAIVGNVSQSKGINVTFNFEAKQADYLTWAATANLDFSTGLAK